MKLDRCPKCGSADVYIDSNRQAEASWIECSDCDHRMQQSVDEETLTERWNALDRSAMPTFDDDV
ncbi:Lar family restriction alleviation protein [Achromobacter xylosoxidans]|uniref:Lar family restriction alleviation protein n=1 Tax=Alcaligenes xylosoxydans xylosoxydans TaxID=85698 RepID=UPI001EEE88BC|nr:Lar family restriction alleviation protein [Achromobacter xylosoxidans]